MAQARVYIVDDSAVVRQVLTLALNKHPGIEVIGSAPDPVAARNDIVRLRPDAITLDLEMPRMDGIEFLQRIMGHFPLPVIVVSSLTPEGSELAVRAMSLGAVDVLCKPGAAYTIGSLVDDIAQRIIAVAGRKIRPHKPKPRDGKPLSLGRSLSTTTNMIIGIGASTGGTVALETVIESLPPTTPGIVIVQHMPPGFTKSFADRLNKSSRLHVVEAEDGMRIGPGRCFIAPGDKHLKVRRQGASYFTKLDDGPRVGLHKPAVNVLFDSIAESARANALGVILTGMGRDGASGLKAMRDAGASTIGQDEESCVVYGMPKEAQNLGAVEKQLPLANIPKAILDVVSEHGKKTSFT